jgi:hypothetical protein
MTTESHPHDPSTAHRHLLEIDHTDSRRLLPQTATDVLARQHDELQDLFVQVRSPDADRVATWLHTMKRLASHVAVERTFVYPAVKRVGLGSPELARDLLHDYKQMEHLLVLTERREVNSPDMPQLVTDLQPVLEAHLERCEKALKPALNELMSQRELEELGAKMRGAENVILSHPHPHLLMLGPVYKSTTRIASRWDRIRDRLVRNR